MTENKVTFGLQNTHYALLHVEGDKVTYDTPKPIKGSVEISIEPKGDIKEFEADNSIYYAAPDNQGYEGTLTIAEVPVSFATEVLGEVLEKDGTVSETADAKTSQFALLFQFEGDQQAVRHVLYSCTAKRPKVGSKTGKEVNTSELSFTVSQKPQETLDEPRQIKRKTTAATLPSVYNDWFKKVYLGGSETEEKTKYNDTKKYDENHKYD